MEEEEEDSEEEEEVEEEDSEEEEVEEAFGVSVRFLHFSNKNGSCFIKLLNGMLYFLICYRCL